MSDSTTRISDLPSNIKFELNDESQGNQAYKPMNVHPNPYGNSNNPDVMPHPESVQVPQPQQTIPSRDIPIDTTSYQQDETIKPNYIPPSNVQDDYIREYENRYNEDLRKYEINKKNEESMDSFLSELQMPIFVGILYFIFQMPLMDGFFKRAFSFLPIKESDGNLNFLGMMTKSFAFIFVFLGFLQLTNYLVKI